MKKYIIAMALCFGIAASAFAQEEKLVVKPSGRILVVTGGCRYQFSKTRF